MAECDVCCGMGDYPIIDRRGSTLYCIRCPECYGSGQAEPEDPGPTDASRESTAARIKTMEELREYVAKNWR